MRLVELLELQVGEGPCFDAYNTHAAVACDSLDDAQTRWPLFARHAREGGFSSVSAVPMRLRSQVIGALNLFSTRSTALTQRDLTVAQAMADIATIGILQERAIHDSRAFSAQLEAALDSRIVIEQAKGIVAQRNQVSVDEAFQQIRHFARSHNRLLSKPPGKSSPARSFPRRSQTRSQTQDLPCTHSPAWLAFAVLVFTSVRSRRRLDWARHSRPAMSPDGRRASRGTRHIDGDATFDLLRTPRSTSTSRCARPPTLSSRRRATPCEGNAATTRLSAPHSKSCVRAATGESSDGPRNGVLSSLGVRLGAEPSDCGVHDR
jgi:hypothetical protein